MVASVKDFRDLTTWQRAMDLVAQVYRMVKKLPSEETYALGSQIRRAVVSIPANIAEGHARQHTKEFLQYLSIARGSTAELWTLLIIAARLSYLTPKELAELEAILQETRRLLSGLINQLKSRA